MRKSNSDAIVDYYNDEIGEFVPVTRIVTRFFILPTRLFKGNTGDYETRWGLQLVKQCEYWYSSSYVNCKFPPTRNTYWKNFSWVD